MFDSTTTALVERAQTWLAEEPAAVSLVLETGTGFVAVSETAALPAATQAEAQVLADRLGEAALLTNRDRWALELCAHAGDEICFALGSCQASR